MQSPLVAPESKPNGKIVSFFASNVVKIAALVMIWAGPSIADEPITVVADEWPPFSGKGLPEQGVSVDVTSAVLERAGYTVKTAMLPWARIVHGAKSGEYDIVSSVFQDAEMQKYLRYSDPFYATEIRFVQRKGGDITFSSLNSLRSYRIAVGSGFLYDTEFDNADFLNKFEVTTTLQGLRMVASGRVDLTLDSTDVVRHSILRGDPGLMDKLEFLDPALSTRQIHIGVSLSRADHARIISDFNRTLKEMQADGSYDRLLEKHNLN